MKRFSIFLTLFLITILNGFEEKCGVFSNVLQTRDNPSKIVMSGDGHIYNSPSCALNTGFVIQSIWYPKLHCGGGTASASKKYGKSLMIDYTFLIDNSTASKKPSSSKLSPVVHSSTTLSGKSYNKITISNWSNKLLTLNLPSSSFLNNLKLTKKAHIYFKTTNNLKIGSIGERWGWNSNNYLEALSTNSISIYNVYLKSKGDINFKAKQKIDIHNLQVGRNGSEVVLKAPKVVIDQLSQTNSGSGTSLIKIYANEVDIETINLGQKATLRIYPYSADSNVTFHSNEITASSSSTMILSSGNYYTNYFDIPGTSGVASVKASDSSQIINFFINGDFSPGNNPGINSNGKGGNFGTLPPANFRLFINGDLSTGGGGTTFNSLIYVEGSARLGSPTYIRGALSTAGDITIKNGGKFYYNNSIENSTLGGVCRDNYTFDNEYSCNVFITPLNSYQSIKTEDDTIFNSCSISVKNKNYIGNLNCYGCSQCNIEEAQKNRLDFKVISSKKTDIHTIHNNFTFTQLEYGNYKFDSSNIDIYFNPQNSYSDNSTKLMLLKDLTFSGDNQTLIFEGGDYHINSFKVDKTNSGKLNKINICPKDDIRLFVKNDFIFRGSIVNDMECKGAIFIYGDGDVKIDTNGKNSKKTPIYIYSKGAVTLLNSANKSADWYGAITAEGPIKIDDDNIKIHFDASKLDKYGIGECKLCYDENYIKTNGFSFFGMTICTPMTPCIFDMPIKNSDKEPLDNVKVVETYKQTFAFAPDFFGFNTLDTIDKNGNHIGNGATKVSNYDYSIFNLFNTTFDSSAIIYDFGDDYPTYSPNEEYYRAYKKSTASFSVNFDFDDWKDNVVYLASYKDKKGRKYDIQIDACPYTNEDTQPNGWLDAWDDYLPTRGESDRNISTKIVNQNFRLKIAYLPKSFTHASSASVKYYLVDKNSSKQHNPISMENYLFINGNSKKVITQTYLLNKAYQNVGVEFKACANYSSSSGYNLYPYANCVMIGDCKSNDEENKICYRYFSSTDSFAVRPMRFKLSTTSDELIKADANISNLKIEAVDFYSNSSKNYNIDSSLLDMKAKDRKCETGDLDYKFKFLDGVANISSIRYSEVGVIDLNLSEKVGKEFAVIDSDDTKLKDRLIGEGTISLSVLPHHFDIKVDRVANYNDSSFTYLSKDLNMSGEANLTIKAVNESGIITKNYNQNCYGKDSKVMISYSTSEPIENLNYIITQLSKNSLDKNISFGFDKDNFQKGEAKLNLNINFDRNDSLVVNPFKLQLDKIVIENEDKIKGEKDISKSLSFLYGAVKVNDITTEKDSMSVPVQFEYWEKRGWKRSLLHNSEQFGAVNQAVVKNFSLFSIGLNKNSISFGEQNLSVNLLKKVAPYKTKLHLHIPGWLWYSSYGIEYKKPSSSNMDCLTHPCVNLLFEKVSLNKWAGEGTEMKENNASTNTIDIKLKETPHNKIYKKMEW